MMKKNQEEDIMAIYEGAGVALITPFKENRDVNYEKLEELVEEQIALGTDSIIACGTTGEASTMTHEEHLDVIKFVCQVTKKRIPVIAGTGSNCTETAVYLSEEAEKHGADGLLLGQLRMDLRLTLKRSLIR
jgi:4-hydroxy-tetrahydrodipicolinate synthase